MNEPFKLYAKNGSGGVIHQYATGSDYVGNWAENTVELTGIDGVMVQYSGLNPPASVLYTTDLSGLNGASFQSSRLGKRNIVLTFHLLWNIEYNRQFLYQYFITGEPVRLTYIGSRKVWIDGFVETVTCNQFAESRKQVIQVSLLCPDPVLRSIDEITHTIAASGDAINYGGEYSNGIVITMTFSGSCSKPTFKCSRDPMFADITLFNGISVNESFSNGDKLVINTNVGQRSVTKISGFQQTDLLSKIGVPTRWSKVYAGKNEFYFTATTGASNISSVEVTTVDTFGGV